MYAPYKDIQVVRMDNLCEKSPESDWAVQVRLKRRNSYEDITSATHGEVVRNDRKWRETGGISRKQTLLAKTTVVVQV